MALLGMPPQSLVFPKQKLVRPGESLSGRFSLGSSAGPESWFSLFRKDGVQFTDAKLAVTPAGETYLSVASYLYPVTGSNTIITKINRFGEVVYSTYCATGGYIAPKPVLHGSEDVRLVLGISPIPFSAADPRRITLIRLSSNGAITTQASFRPQNDPQTPGGSTIKSIDSAYYSEDISFHAGEYIDHNSPFTAAAVIKLSQSGGIQWVRAFEGSASNQPTNFGKVCVDGQGNSYAVATEANSGNVFPVVKLDPSGNVLFQKRINGVYGNDNQFRPSGIALSPNGDVFIAGQNQGIWDNAVLCLSSSGTLKWAKSLGSGFLSSIVVDPVGSIYVLGDMGNGLTLVKLSESGGLLWNRSFTGSSVGPQDMALSKEFIHFSGSASSSDVLLGKIPIDWTGAGTTAGIAYGAININVTNQALTLSDVSINNVLKTSISAGNTLSSLNYKFDATSVKPL
jgi:hypothetical protein